MFYGASGRGVSESIPHVFRSWYCNHGGGCKTDMRKLQASAHYAMPEQDAQSWHSLPCYNEIFYTPAVVRNRADSVDMWRQLVEHWLPAARQNVREMFDMPGAAILHGYLPPVKPDRYVHTNSQLEFCVDSAAQMLKTLWDEWDYSGDPALLRNTLYPALRELAIFYAAYAQRESDGYYHVMPAVEAEAWGIYPEFSRNKDTISALCMFRWAFLRAAEAAEYLGVDADLRKAWLTMAGRMAPYPTHDAATGKIFSGLPGVAPRWKQGDHPWSIQVYPTTLADEITLDSGEALRAMMIRTAYELPARPNSEVLALLGACKETVASVSGRAAQKIDDIDVLREEVNRHPERVLNSRGGRMHLFPCVPDWAAIAFRRFQARGGFAVSAVKKPDGVSFVQIEARRDNTCRVMNPWPGRPVEVCEEPGGRVVAAIVDRANGECVVFTVRRGCSYELRRKVAS